MPSKKFVGCLIGSVAFTIFGFLGFASLIIIPHYKQYGEIPKVHDAMSIIPEHYLLLIAAEIIYILLYLIQYMRYLEVKEYFLINKQRFMSVVNKVSFVLGFLLIFSFKVYTQYKLDQINKQFQNLISIVICSSFMIHCTLQTIISCRMSPRIVGYFTLFLRMFTILFYITIIAVNFIPNLNKNIYEAILSLDIHWGADYTLFQENCYDASEWLTVVTYWLYLITYVVDFDKMAISPPKIYINYVSHMEYLKNTLQF